MWRRSPSRHGPRVRYLRVRHDHADSGRIRRRNDLRVLLPLGNDDSGHEVAHLLATGLYEEVPDAKTLLVD